MGFGPFAERPAGRARPGDLGLGRRRWPTRKVFLLTIPTWIGEVGGGDVGCRRRSPAGSGKEERRRPARAGNAPGDVGTAGSGRSGPIPARSGAGRPWGGAGAARWRRGTPARVDGGDALREAARGDGRRGGCAGNGGPARSRGGPDLGSSGPRRSGARGGHVARAGWMREAAAMTWRPLIGRATWLDRVDMSGRWWDVLSGGARSGARVHPRNDPKFRGGVLFYR